MDRRFKESEERTDRRFDAVDARMRAGFESVHAKLDALMKTVETQYGHHDRILVEHDARLGDLERRVGTSPAATI
jgi:hypothetical protein